MKPPQSFVVTFHNRPGTVTTEFLAGVLRRAYPGCEIITVQEGEPASIEPGHDMPEALVGKPIGRAISTAALEEACWCGGFHVTKDHAYS